MNPNIDPSLTVKDRYEPCKVFECPRLLALCNFDAEGNPSFNEGDDAYVAIVLCNNWDIGLSSGDCPVLPSVLEEQGGNT